MFPTLRVFVKDLIVKRELPNDSFVDYSEIVMTQSTACEMSHQHFTSVRDGVLVLYNLNRRTGPSILTSGLVDVNYHSTKS